MDAISDHDIHYDTYHILITDMKLPFICMIIFLIGLLSPVPAWAETGVLISPHTGDLAVPAAINESKIKIGILVMKSGFISDIGTEYLNAFDLLHRDTPDSRMQLVIADGGSDRRVAAENWSMMKNNSPDLAAVITVSSWTSNVVYPEAAESGITQIALGSAAINRTLPQDHLIRFTPGGDQEVPILAAYLEQFNRVAVIGGRNDYSDNYFARLNSLLPGKIVLNSRYDQDNVTLTLNPDEIARAEPDAVVLLSVSEGGDVIRILRNKGIDVPFIGTRVIQRNSLADTKEAEGLIFTTPVLNSSHPFFSHYREEYGDNATFYAAEGYDALNTLNSAVSACNYSSNGIYSWFLNRTYNGTLGEVTFDDRGVAHYPIGFKIIHGGEFMDYPVQS